MKREIWSQLLFTSLILVFGTMSFAQGGGYTIGDYSSYYSFDGNMGPGSKKSDQSDSSCDNSISNANRAFAQFMTDLKGKAYQWSLNSDIDAVGEVSYFLKTNCKTKNLDLINAGQTGLNATQDRACEVLMGMLTKVLEEREATSFRGGFEGGIKLVGKSRRLAKYLGDDCKPTLVIREENANNTQVTKYFDPSTTGAGGGESGTLDQTANLQVFAINQTTVLANDTMPVTLDVSEDAKIESQEVVTTNLRPILKKAEDIGEGNLFIIDTIKYF